jgi:type II secretory pathway predicted ATPase ExeA
MYHAHFGLREEPFGVSPDRRFFFQTEQHREAVATLYYSIQQRRGFALLVGQPGLGKTSVLAQLVQLLENKADTAYLPHPFFDRTTVLEAILESFGIQSTTSPARNHRLFYDHLMEVRRAGKTCVVIFDEAQELNRDTLEAIRMLSNFETLSEKLVQIVLAGQPGLSETLRQAECDQIRQRLSAVCQLRPLNRALVDEYIDHRLQIAGGEPSLFDAGAREAIAMASAGIPRNINTICFNSLSLAYALDLRQVGCSEVKEAVADLDLFVRAHRITVNSAKLEALSKLRTETVQSLHTVRQPVPGKLPEPPKELVSEVPPLPPAEPASGSTVEFAQMSRSFRPTWIAGAAIVLAALPFVIRNIK